MLLFYSCHFALSRKPEITARISQGMRDVTPSPRGRGQGEGEQYLTLPLGFHSHSQLQFHYPSKPPPLFSKYSINPFMLFR